jgi:hypothetical protein
MEQSGYQPEGQPLRKNERGRPVGGQHQFTLQDRIVSWAKDVRAQAAELPPGPGREMLLKKVQQAETAMHLESWAKPQGLQPPK